VAPGLAIHRVVDLALKSVPGVEVGILFVERQFGVLEVHSADLDEVTAAGQAILAGIGGGRATSCGRGSCTRTSSRTSPTSTR
jgi:hypothetical protein